MSRTATLQLFKQQLRYSSTRPFLVAPSVAATPNIPPSPINHSPKEANKRKWLPLRCGSIAKKIGMAPYFNTETGEKIGATLLQLNNVEVILHRTMENNGYFACQVGYGDKEPEKVTRQLLGHFASHSVNPKLEVSEFRVKSETGLLPIGTLIKPSFFKQGQYIDTSSISKGKGFAGVMKRHHFKGLRASHGTTLNHRHGGSYGQCQDPGRILPGRKMPGHMGVQKVTIRNLLVLKCDDENGVIWVKGDVAGPKGSFVKITDALKKQSP